jgi:hypothetical protein
MDDELMSGVRRVLSRYHQAHGEPDTVPQRLRDVASLDIVDGETWALLRELVDAGETFA